MAVNDLIKGLQSQEQYGLWVGMYASKRLVEAFRSNSTHKLV